MTPGGLFRQDSDRLLQGVMGGGSKKHDSGKYPGTHPMWAPKSGKKCATPRRMAQRGGFAHFFSKIGDGVGWVPGYFLKNWSK